MTAYPIQCALYIALDLGSTKWVLAMTNGGQQKPRIRQIPARDLDRLKEEIAVARKLLKLSVTAPVRTCYEAGRDGFWLHRYLEQQGYESLVINAGSLERKQQGKRRKTDRIDAETLANRLVRYHAGETSVWSCVHVPSAKAEDIRRVERERERIKGERSALRSRIASVLALHGIPKPKTKVIKLDELRTPTGKPLLPHAMSEVRRLIARLELADAQNEELKAERDEAAKEDERIRQSFGMLSSLKGVGELSAFALTTESFGWRDFDNVRQVSASSGLAPTPHQSDGMRRELGISKEARPKLRSLMVQLAWLWLRYQPTSALTLWFHKRFMEAGGRAKRVGIVALARKLYVAFWKLVTSGEVPEGALLKTS
jgi:transposase